MDFIQHKRIRSTSKNLYKRSKMCFKKESNISPDNRDIIFKNVDGKDIILHINTIYELKNKLNEFNFLNPYYIKDGKDIIIDNVSNFFHLTSVKEIYNLEYHNFIDKTKFDLQYNSIPNDIKKENISLDKFFLFNTNFYIDHLVNYDYICFTKLGIDLSDLRGFASYSEEKLNVIEIFGKKKMGITTELSIFYSQLRTRKRTKEKFIPFFIVDFLRLFELKKLNVLIDLLNYYLLNLFVEYEKYNEFCVSIMSKIKKLGFKISEIILLIIKEYINYIKNEDMLYLPVIIIDNYTYKYDINNIFYNSLIQLQENYKFKIIIKYSLDNNFTNKKILEYLNEEKNESFKMKFYNIIHSVRKLPCKYEKYFKLIIPSITNFIKIENCKNEDEVKYLIKQEEEDIKNEIFKFYNNDSQLMSLYLNEISLLINKTISFKNDFIQNLFLYIPLNILDIDILDYNHIQINYSCAISKKVIDNICSNTIIELIKKPIFMSLNNFIQDGLFEYGIEIILQKNNSIFGEINQTIEFDCILNTFKKKKDYNFSDEEIESKLKLKSIQELKKKFNNFIFGNKILIKQKQNGKDWDFGLIQIIDDIINFCPIQVSINKKIKEIQEILRDFQNKNNFMKKKIKEILNIEIINTNILFILLKQFQNRKTLTFLEKYKIPYILFDLHLFCFLNDKEVKITNYIFNEETSFTINKKSWEDSIYEEDNINYGKDDNPINVEEDEEEEEEEEKEEEEKEEEEEEEEEEGIDKNKNNENKEKNSKKKIIYNKNLF